ncbi:hypothetical protein [Aureitalea marina]|uniref:hypothetical protein n=1 Tax=Aureitalea marina TaxID=930804 RepID=UPI001FE7160E|nr:hypothetical protein [Aureitalea marina]
MSTAAGFIEGLHQKLLSESIRRKVERFFLVLALVSFLVHLAVIYMGKLGWINLGDQGELLQNPIAAIYTPFPLS